jgi:hypothetical protein
MNVLFITLLYICVSAGLGLRPIIEMSLPSNTDVVVFSQCSPKDDSPSSCKIVTSREKHLRAIAQSVNTICSRYTHIYIYIIGPSLWRKEI